MRLTVYRLIGADFIFYCHNSQIVEPKLQALALHLIFSCDVTISQNNRYSNRRFIASQLQTNRNRYMYAKSTLHLQVHVPNVLMTHIFIIIIDFEYENRLTSQVHLSRIAAYIIAGLKLILPPNISVTIRYVWRQNCDKKPRKKCVNLQVVAKLMLEEIPFTTTVLVIYTYRRYSASKYH